MKLGLGTVKGDEIATNRDSSSPARLISAEISDPEDIQTVELITSQGEDFKPEVEDVMLVIPLSSAYKLGWIIDDGIAPDPTILSGEKEFYSKAGGVKLAKLKLDKDSQVILNEGTDFAVKYLELKTQIDKLRLDLIAHVHPGVASGGGSTGVSVTPFTVNVDGTKADKIRI